MGVTQCTVTVEESASKNFVPRRTMSPHAGASFIMYTCVKIPALRKNIVCLTGRKRTLYQVVLQYTLSSVQEGIRFLPGVPRFSKESQPVCLLEFRDRGTDQTTQDLSHVPLPISRGVVFTVSCCGINPRSWVGTAMSTPGNPRRRK